MSFVLYLAGFVIVAIGVALGAHLMHVPGKWIAVIVIILVGLGIVMGVTTTRRRDPPG
jgi:uncharacterized membrane protein YiaA